MKPVVSFSHVSKRYELGAQTGNLRGMLSSIPRRLLGGKAAEPKNEFWALRDVSFDVARGSVLGLIGHNGAGKTTTLKLLANVTQPSMGRIDVEGRVSALIELGAGFHPDLTGRENVYLNGAILGMSRRELDSRFDDIVDFAELHQFIDTPVKRYSSGMYARLGFAVAAHTDPDLLVVDEVLGVGDTNFQQKCFRFVHSFVASEHKSALFVSHNLVVIEQLCEQIVWLDHGEVIMIGTPQDVLPRYYDALEEAASGQDYQGTASGGLNLEPLVLEDAHGNSRDVFYPGEDVVVRVPYFAASPVEGPQFVLAIDTSGGGSRPLVMASMLADGESPTRLLGTGTVTCRFQAPPLMPRLYEVWGEVWTSDGTENYVRWSKWGSFRVAAAAALVEQSLPAGGLYHQRVDGPVRVAHAWEF